MLLESLPTHLGPMSVYTLCALTIMVSAGVLFTTTYVRYNSNEFRRVEFWVSGEVAKLESAINGHDDYIATTTAVINQIHVDLAVQKNSMKDLKEDLAEIKSDIKTLLKR